MKAGDQQLRSAITPDERRDLFDDGAPWLTDLILNFLAKSLPGESSFSTAPNPTEWMLDKVRNEYYHLLFRVDSMKVRVFKTAKVPLLMADSRMVHLPMSLANFRMATLQARERPLRYDCVSAVDSLSLTPKTVFRAQVLGFFKLSAKDIGATATDDVTFCLIGSFRTIQHEPYKIETVPGSTVTREQLLGGAGHFLIPYPPNHITMEAAFKNEWQLQRFKIVGLGDLKASAHIIPLSNRTGKPLLASFQPDAKMHATIPNATRKSLYYLNTCVY